MWALSLGQASIPEDACSHLPRMQCWVCGYLCCCQEGAAKSHDIDALEGLLAVFVAGLQSVMMSHRFLKERAPAKSA